MNAFVNCVLCDLQITGCLNAVETDFEAAGKKTNNTYCLLAANTRNAVELSSLNTNI